MDGCMAYWIYGWMGVWKQKYIDVCIYVHMCICWVFFKINFQTHNHPLQHTSTSCER